MKRLTYFVAVAILATGVVPLSGQQERPLSPPGTATTMLGGQWTKNAQGNPVYEGGKWIEVTYSRPMLRQRPNIFGTGKDYGTLVTGDAPVWRVGANQTTRFKTEVPLVFEGKTLPVGEYSMFVDLNEGAWTLIFSTWPAQKEFDPEDKTALFGSAGYTPERDVLRARMEVSTGDSRVDQLTILFRDVTANSGKLAIAWDTTTATVPFTVARATAARSAQAVSRRGSSEPGPQRHDAVPRRTYRPDPITNPIDRSTGLNAVP